LKDRIVCLVGESGSGKSTIAELLENEGYNYIQSYTDRPRRYKNERGHIFITRKEYFQVIIKDKLKKDIIAPTCFGGNHYFATKKQYKGKGVSIYVIDAKGVKQLRQTIKDAKIVVIYLKCDKWTRAIRMWCRKNKNNVVSYSCPENWDNIDTDIKERILHDEQSFKVVSCDYVVDANRDIEEVLKDVKNIINT